MGRLAVEKRDNEILITMFWGNSKGEKQLLVAWWHFHTQESLIRSPYPVVIILKCPYAGTKYIKTLPKIRQSTHTDSFHRFLV